MSGTYEILPLRLFTQAEIWPILTGYETNEIYAVEKIETDLRATFDVRLIRLDKSFQDTFNLDFTTIEMEHYLGLLPQGFSLAF